MRMCVRILHYIMHNACMQAHRDRVRLAHNPRRDHMHMMHSRRDSMSSM